MQKISEHITSREAIQSITARNRGIENVPNKQQLINMIDLAVNVFEPTRKALGNRPIRIASFYRCPKLNKAIGGAKKSQHMAKNGAAMDIDNDNMPAGPINAAIFFHIWAECEFDQLIWEYGDDDNPEWVHVSYNADHNRHQVLKCVNGRYYNFE